MAIIKGTLIPTLFSVGLLMMTFVLGFELIVFSDNYFEWHYENRGITETTEMDVDGLMYVTREMLDYLKGDRANLDMEAVIAGKEQEVFGKREKDHMIDVQLLYLGARNLRRMGMVIVGCILFLGWFFSKDMLLKVLLRAKYYVGALMVFVLILGGLFATDFEKYFTIFHEVFFTNDLWLLDPRTDILINMVPYSYFYSIVMIGVLLFIIMIAAALVMAQVFGKRLKRSLT